MTKAEAIQQIASIGPWEHDFTELEHLNRRLKMAEKEVQNCRQAKARKIKDIRDRQKIWFFFKKIIDTQLPQ